MLDEALFSQIRKDLSENRFDGLTVKVSQLSDTTDDPIDLLTCMSLLKVVPDDGTSSHLANRIVSLVNEENGLDVCTALRSLDCPTFALAALRNLPESDGTLRVKRDCQMDMDEDESALATESLIKVRNKDDDIRRTEILSSVGEHSKAIQLATDLLTKHPKDYDVRICYVSALLLGGHDKEAQKYVRDGVKDKSADSNAVAAYVLRILGNIKAAGGYASRAVQLDSNHIGAMETLGICLALKSEYDKAKIVAGAINEISPGNKAAINILSYCEGH